MGERTAYSAHFVEPYKFNIVVFNTTIDHFLSFQWNWLQQIAIVTVICQMLIVLL